MLWIYKNLNSSPTANDFYEVLILNKHSRIIKGTTLIYQLHWGGASICFLNSNSCSLRYILCSAELSSVQYREGMNCKSHLNFQLSKEREEANARERIRNYSVNSAFVMLRNLIPTEPPDRKLSKIETLRLACSYISHLGSILVKGTCEISTTGASPKGPTFAQRSQICTFCLTSAKLQPN